MHFRARKLIVALTATGVLALAAPAAAFAAFGAIYANPVTLKWGKSWNYSTKRGAELRAKQECGPGCQGVIWYKNECGAVFINSSRTKFYYAFGLSKRSAKNKVRRAHPTATFITAGCATHG